MRQSLPPVTVITLCSDKKLDDEPTYLQNNILAMHGEAKQTDKYPGAMQNKLVSVFSST